MSRGDSWVALTPWSFFLPTLLAAALGVFLADAAGRLVFGADVDADHATAAADAAHAAAPAGPQAPARPAEPSAAASATARDAATGATAAARATALPVLEPARLPGPTVARRDGEERACINGTVARRASNGWEQEMAEDAPARCLATSP